MNAGPTTVLMYHRLGGGKLPGRETGEEVYAVAPETFEAQLETLVSAQSHVLSPSELLGGRRQPTKGGDRCPSFCLTFDDGNLSDHQVALPAIRRRGWQGLFFVVPAWIGTTGYMTWAEVRELHREGMTIGAHGLDHTRLGKIDDAEVCRQLRESRDILEAELGQAPRTLSLPGGSGGRRVVRLAVREGFELVATSYPQVARPSHGVAPLPRFAVRRGDSPRDVRALVEQHPAAVWPQLARHLLLQSACALLGEGTYARLRALWTQVGRGTGGSEPGRTA